MPIIARGQDDTLEHRLQDSPRSDQIVK